MIALFATQLSWIISIIISIIHYQNISYFEVFVYVRVHACNHFYQADVSVCACPWMMSKGKQRVEIQEK